jgi:tetratricopeptide (TPR) repeat protein
MGEATRQRQAIQAKGLLALGHLSLGGSERGEGARAGEAAVRLYEQLGNQQGLCYALGVTGFNTALQGDLARADQTLTQAITLARETDNKAGLAFALSVRSGLVLLPRGDITAARAHTEEAVHLAREIDSPYIAAQIHMDLMHMAAALGEWDVARIHAREALAGFHTIGEQGMFVSVYSSLGHIERGAGHLAEAQRIYEQTIVTFQDSGRSAVAHELECFAFIARAQGQPARAARLLGAAEALREAIDAPISSLEPPASTAPRGSIGRRNW